jgi:hypothetical protein
MKHSRDARDEDYWMRVALNGCLAALLLVLCLVLVGDFDMPISNSTAASVGTRARAKVAQDAHEAASQGAVARGMPQYRGTPFVSDEGGSAPGPLQQ